MLTGESLPVEKSAGSNVSARDTEHLRQLCDARHPRQIGNRTFADHSSGGTGQRSQAPIQQLADRVASLFVPVVLALGLLTFTPWMFRRDDPRLFHALTAAVSVLMIACPAPWALPHRWPLPSNPAAARTSLSLDH